VVVNEPLLAHEDAGNAYSLINIWIRKIKNEKEIISRFKIFFPDKSVDFSNGVQ
jgi:hypothetical protein